MSRLWQGASINRIMQQYDIWDDCPSRSVCVFAVVDMHHSTQLNSSSLQHAITHGVVRKTYAHMLACHFTQLVTVKCCTFCKETRDIVGQVPVTECEAQSVDGMYPSPGLLLRIIACHPKQLPHTCAIRNASSDCVASWSMSWKRMLACQGALHWYVHW